MLTTTNNMLLSHTPPVISLEIINSEAKNSIDFNPLWENRTPEINQCISRAFQGIATNTKSDWGVFNGCEEYNIGGIKEHKLLKKIIQGSPPECKDFYALDIGAGNYQWGRELAKYLNGKKDIPKDVTIHIIGIRGEINLNDPVTNLGQCKLYEFGQFQIETLIVEFQRRGLQLANKVDIVVSRWCFRHFVDPVGTFAQTYNLLRPKTGHLLIDGFFYLNENENINGKRRKPINFNARMTQLCLETGTPFLTRYHDGNKSLNHFILNKFDDHPCHLNKQYLGIENIGHNWQIGSESVIRFKELEEHDLEISPFLYQGDYQGDKGLYERLKQNGLLSHPDSVWGPLQEKDAIKKTPSLHKLISNGDDEAIYQCLEKGSDINESDYMGFTPLHLTIKHNNYKLFLLLLEKGALIKLSANGYTPFHLAMQYDLEGCFIKALITNVDVDITTNGTYKSKLTPLDIAIMHKNVRAVEFLLESNADVSSNNLQSMENNSAFSSIKHLLHEKMNEFERFNT